MKQCEVTFCSEETKVVGNVYLPDDYREDEKRPGTIANFGWTRVNKMYPVMFARQMTARGFVCMGFDYRGFKPFGSISGMDKYATSEMEIDDINNAVAFFKHQPEMDVGHIALIDQGISGAVCIVATYRDRTVKAVVTLNSSTDGRRWMHTGTGNDRFNRMLRTLEEDKYKRVTTGDPILRHSYEFYPSIDESGDFYVEKTSRDLNGSAKGGIEVECGESSPTPMLSVITENPVRFDVQDILSKLAPDYAVFVGHGKYNELHDRRGAEDICRLANEPEQLYYVDGKRNERTFDEDPEPGGLCDAMAESSRAHIRTQFQVSLLCRPRRKAK